MFFEGSRTSLSQGNCPRSFWNFETRRSPSSLERLELLQSRAWRELQNDTEFGIWSFWRVAGASWIC
ncbi:hypothetical protein B9Z55_002697 [Caenorhabditis nigoni]|uniref:Uncharacterized protein n=1 Tax=Caenorhabditis nigoni TaxID=1611254 RepID=A0A2G5VM08_9PELO|nr:hypothetical protein B9Z55_002697 [Caenorhabditis nigoni]